MNNIANWIFLWQRIFGFILMYFKSSENLNFLRGTDQVYRKRACVCWFRSVFPPHYACNRH